MTTTTTAGVQMDRLDFNQMLTPKEVAEELGLTPHAIYKSVERGHLTAYRKRPHALHCYLMPDEVREYYGPAESGRW